MAVRLRWLALLLALVPVAACRAEPSAGGAGAPLVLERTIPLNGVRGRIDHLAIDPGRQRLFVAELGNGSVEAVDLARGVSLGRITGLKEPQGVAYLAARDELVVASGGDGAVRFYRAADLALQATVALGGDADNVRVDPRSGRVIIGYGSGALATLDPTTRTVVARLALPAHPESFRTEGGRVFVNVPDAGKIVVGDLASGQVTGTWAAAHGFNFAMALNEAARTIAVAYRLPPRLQILDMETGASKADAATCGDADDVFFDGKRGLVYVICGSGEIETFDADRLRSRGRMPTRRGARTGLFAPDLDRLIVAARASGGDGAAILIYRPARIPGG
jgi:hypothetical protein